MDVVVTVPKTFRFNARRGLIAWLSEGDPPGAKGSGNLWSFETWGAMPNIRPGERVYVVCEGRLVGYAPLVGLDFESARGSLGHVRFIRGGGAVACTIDESVRGFRGWRYRWWRRADERPLDLNHEIRAAREAAASAVAEQTP